MSSDKPDLRGGLRPLRDVRLDAGHDVRDPRRSTVCHSPGCELPTREGKPACSDHLGLMPYALRVWREFWAGKAGS